MSRTVQEIFSRVQQDLGDIAAKDIQLAEYIDACKDISDKLAYDTQVYLNEYTGVPNPSSSPIDPAPTSITIPLSQRIARIERVERNGKPCWETGRSLVDNMNQGYYPNTVNSTTFSQNVYSTLRGTDDSLKLNFVYPFAEDEEVLVRYFAHNQINPVTWLTGTIVPQVLTEVIELGMLERFVFRKMQQGLPVGIETRYPIILDKFKKAYGRAMANTRNLIDDRAFIKAEPYKFLAE